MFYRAKLCFIPVNDVLYFHIMFYTSKWSLKGLNEV